MSRVKSKNTGPELKLRRLLLDLGYRGYRIHFDKLPGKPDIVFTSSKKVIFVHGCFWHGHNCPAGSHRPKTNKDYWEAKLQRNIERDKELLSEIKSKDWKVLVVWECQLKQLDEVRIELAEFLRESKTAR